MRCREKPTPRQADGTAAHGGKAADRLPDRRPRIVMAPHPPMLAEPTRGATAPSLRRYLLARHGETDFNREGRVQGSSDASVLTPEGLVQAGALGAYVARRQAGEERDDRGEGDVVGTSPPVARTWCSPLTRCRQTYDAVAEACRASSSSSPPPSGRPLPAPTIRQDMREIEFPGWEGRLRRDVAREDADNWNMFRTDPMALRLGQGGKFSPILDCWERAQGNWEAVRTDRAASSTKGRDVCDGEGNESGEEEEGAVFIMCHGALGQCMLLRALGIEIETYSYRQTRTYAFDNCECVEIEWEDGEDCALRWRRVHPVPTEWQLASTSRQMNGSLSCGR
ncbi:hypothetical protein ACHAWF_002496 [Thalassiosira exigua]